MTLVAESGLCRDHAEVASRVRCNQVERMRKAQSTCRSLGANPEMSAKSIDQMPLAPTDGLGKRANGDLPVRALESLPSPDELPGGSPCRLCESVLQKLIHSGEPLFPRARVTQSVQKDADRLR